MSRPRILIPLPTSFDEPYNTQCWPEYAAAIDASGGEAVQVPLTLSHAELQALAGDAAAVLLPGSGADVDPARYGHDRDPASAEADPLRENTDRALLEACERSGKPLLGVCFGTQSMNVFYGGTLIQDLNPLPLNHRAGRSVRAAHAALLADQSVLGALLQDADDTARRAGALRTMVNSSHHQAVGIVGEGLRAVANCPDDGVVEAIEGNDPGKWLVGVQWHPERTWQTSGASRALLRGLVEAAMR